MPSFLQRGGGWVLVQNTLTLAILAVGPLQRVAGWPRPAQWIGGLVFIAGATFGITGVRALGRNRTPFPALRAEHHLVQSGVYRVVRHPLYTSLILLGLGWGLIWSSPLTLVLTIALALVLDGKARVEERLLLERYREYTEYKTRVARLLPGLY